MTVDEKLAVIERLTNALTSVGEAIRSLSLRTGEHDTKFWLGSARAWVDYAEREYDRAGLIEGPEAKVPPSEPTKGSDPPIVAEGLGEIDPEDP